MIDLIDYHLRRLSRQNPVKKIALEALGNGGGWIGKMRACARQFGWEVS
jgi:hypothetical protein